MIFFYVNYYILPEIDYLRIYILPSSGVICFPADEILTDVQDVTSHRDYSSCSDPDLWRKCSSVPRQVVEDGQQPRCR